MATSGKFQNRNWGSMPVTPVTPLPPQYGGKSGVAPAPIAVSPIPATTSGQIVTEQKKKPFWMNKTFLISIGVVAAVAVVVIIMAVIRSNLRAKRRKAMSSFSSSAIKGSQSAATPSGTGKTQTQETKPTNTVPPTKTATEKTQSTEKKTQEFPTAIATAKSLGIKSKPTPKQVEVVESDTDDDMGKLKETASALSELTDDKNIDVQSQAQTGDEDDETPETDTPDDSQGDDDDDVEETGEDDEEYDENVEEESSEVQTE